MIQAPIPVEGRRMLASYRRMQSHDRFSSKLQERGLLHHTVVSPVYPNVSFSISYMSVLSG